MSVTPSSLARAFRNKTAQRAAITDTSEVKVEADAATFFVYDNDGGVLKVTVAQYKEPIR
jgi:hypothetical protein